MSTTTNNDDEVATAAAAAARVKELLFAIKKNDIYKVSLLISRGIQNVKSKQPPLVHAAAFGRLEIIAMLLDAGVDIDVPFTACRAAARSDQFDALKLLVERGAPVQAVVSREDSLLVAARQAYSSGSQMIVFLLDSGVPIVNLTPDDLIAMTLSMAVVQRLKDRNVNVAVLHDRFGGTLCHHVIDNVKSSRETEGGIDSHNAAEVVGLVPIHQAALARNKTALRVLVELGADIDQQAAQSGETACHHAIVRNGQGIDSFFEFLLALGPNVNLVTKFGATAGHLVARLQNGRVLAALVAAGGNLDQKDTWGETPRSIAADCGFSLPTDAEIDAARSRIASKRLRLVRYRALEICIGLQQLDLNALQLCEILRCSFGALASLIAFHQWWEIATTVKHFHEKRKAQLNKTQNIRS